MFISIAMYCIIGGDFQHLVEAKSYYNVIFYYQFVMIVDFLLIFVQFNCKWKPARNEKMANRVRIPVAFVTFTQRYKYFSS